MKQGLHSLSAAKALSLLAVLFTELRHGSQFGLGLALLILGNGYRADAVRDIAGVVGATNVDGVNTTHT